MPVEIKAWFRERGRALDQCVVATLIIVAGAGSWDDLFARALWLPTTLLALVAFRLMDDLASVESDRTKKPVPVHATLTNLAPLRHALGVLALLTLLSTVVFRDWLVSGALGLILLSYHIGYTVFPERSWSAHRHSVVHLKYPALVLILALPMSRGDVAGALGVFAIFGLFELVDDPKFYRDSTRVVYASGYGTLIALAVLLRMDVDGGSQALHEALIAAVVAVAFGIGVRGQKGVGRTLKYLPFAVGLLSLLISGNRVPG